MSGELTRRNLLKAHAAGIKVISYDRLILHTDVDLYLSFDNYHIGELQGQYLVTSAPRGNYACFGGAPTDQRELTSAAWSAVKPQDAGAVGIAVLGVAAAAAVGKMAR